MSREDQGQTLAAFIQRELEVERERRKWLDARGVAVITTSGSLTALVGAVGAFVSGRPGFRLASDAVGPLTLFLVGGPSLSRIRPLQDLVPDRPDLADRAATTQSPNQTGLVPCGVVTFSTPSGASTSFHSARGLRPVRARLRQLRVDARGDPRIGVAQVLGRRLDRCPAV